MAFRDDELATRSRVDALEDELKDLQAENEALKRAASQPRSARRRSSSAGTKLSLALATIAVLGGVLASWLMSGPVVVLALAMAGCMVALAAMLYFVTLLIVSPAPGHMLVISGRRHVTPDGQTRGFRVITGGTTLRLPLLEVCQELPTGPFPIETALDGIYASAGQVNVAFRARVVVARQEPLVVNAVERFAGHDEGELMRVGTETLESVIRAVVAERTMQALLERRVEAEEALKAEAGADLAKLGLQLEFFEFTDVSAA